MSDIRGLGFPVGDFGRALMAPGISLSDRLKCGLTDLLGPGGGGRQRTPDPVTRNGVNVLGVYKPCIQRLVLKRRVEKTTFLTKWYCKSAHGWMWR